MGYDIYVDGRVLLPKENIRSACEALIEASKQHTGGWEPKARNAAALVSFIEDQTCFGASKDASAVIIEAPEDCVRRVNEDEWVFEALGPFIARGGVFDFRGEDGLQWKWSFEGKLDIEDSAVVFGADCNAPAICKDLVNLLYDGSKIRVHADPQEALDRIEGWLRKHGFGPFAGLDTLDAIAKAVE